MATQFNVIYTNNGPRTPNSTGFTSSQTVAGIDNLQFYLQKVQPAPVAPLSTNPYAAAVIQSNGENIGNARLASNPLPPGRTK